MMLRINKSFKNLIMVLTKEYLLALKSLPGIGTQKLLKIGNYIKDNNIDIKSISDLVPILNNLKVKVSKVEVDSALLEDAMLNAKNIIETNEKAGIGITTYYDDDFPETLREAINEEGKLEPPMILFYKGDLSITKMPQLAVIGTREVTSFGEKAGTYLTGKFCEQGFCIVSGLAIGCDTVGHKAALASGGKTIAFLAHGLDSVYPPENKELAQEIVEKGGLLMSEYPVETGVNRYNLVARDRLQAGLAKATLVIQTGEQGGTMHASNTTLKANKPLYVVSFSNPEQNNHEKSLGNALLVKKGAKYIYGSDDIKSIADQIKRHATSNTLF